LPVSSKYVAKIAYICLITKLTANNHPKHIKLSIIVIVLN